LHYRNFEGPWELSSKASVWSTQHTVGISVRSSSNAELLSLKWW